MLPDDLESTDFSWLIAELNRLERVASALSGGSSHRGALEEILRAVAEALNARMSSLSLVDETGSLLDLAAATGLPDDFTSAIFPSPISENAACCGRAAATCSIVVIEDIRKDPVWSPFLDASQEAGLRAMWSLPIVNALGRAIGTFAFYYAQPHRPNERDRHLAEVYARQAAIAIENSRLHEESERDRRRLRSIFDQIPLGIFIARAPDGASLMMNRAARKLLGKAPEGIDLSEFHATSRLTDAQGAQIPDDEKPLARALRGVSTHQREYLHTGPEGVKRKYMVSAIPLRYADETIFGGMLIFNDDTERRRAEEALRAMEKRFHVAFNSSPHSMVITTLKEGRYIEVNETFLRLTGYKREDVIGRRSIDLNIWSDPDFRSMMVRMIEKHGHVRDQEVRFRRKSGEEMVMLFSAEKIILNGEECILTATNDITERKRAEEALRASEERFAIAFNASPDPMSISTLSEGRYIDVNESFLRITGYSRQDIIGRTTLEVGFWGNFQDRALILQLLGEHGKVRNLEIDYRARSGRLRAARLSAQVINLDQRECILAVYNDITEREKASRIQSAIYRISEAATSSETLQALFHSIHQIVGELLPAGNFYIALYDPVSEEVSFPYFVDERDSAPAPRKMGTGLTELVIKSGKPLQATPEGMRSMVAEGKAQLIGALSVDWFGVPLKTQDRTIGALVLQSYDEDLRFGEEEKNILVFVSTQVAMAIERKRAEEMLRQRVEQLQTIYHLSEAVNCAEAIADIYEAALSAFRQALRVDRSSILLFDPDGVIRFKAWHRLSEDYRNSVEGHSPWPRDEKNAHPIFIPDVKEAPELEELKPIICGEGIRALGFIPLVHQGRLLGKFMLYYDAPHRFTAEEAQIAQTIASHVAMAIERKRSEDAVRASEERFSKAFNLSPHPMVLHSLKDGRISDANDSYLRALGFTRREITGRTPEELGMWRDEDRDAFVQLLRQRREIRNLETQYFTKSGHLRKGLLSAEIIQIAGEKFVLLGVLDVTERLLSEAALRASEERFSKAFHASPDPMSINRIRDGVYIDVNEASTRAFGYLREEMIGHTSDELGTWVNQQERDRIIEMVRSGSRIHNLETSYVTKSGEVRVVLMSAEVIELDGERCLLSTLTDITERKRAEEALQASEERFSKAFHASPDPMSISTLVEGRYIDVNESFLRVNGNTREEVIGHTALEIGLWFDPEKRAAFVERLAQHGRIRDLEVEARTREGGPRVFLLSGEVIEIGGRQCALITGNDITERKRAEQEKAELLAREQQARREAEAARREWQTTFDMMTDSVALVDSQDHLLRANGAFYARFNLAMDQSVGRPLREIIHAGRDSFIDADSCPVCAQRAKAEHGVIELPAGVAAPYPMVVTVDPIIDADGRTVAVIEVTRDQSELYHAREEAERERVTLSAAIEQMAEGLMIFDESARVVRANEQALNIFGLSLDEVTSIPSEMLAEGRFSDEAGNVLPVSELPVQTAIRERRIIERRLWYARPDGRKVLLSHTASPFFNERNHPAGAIALARDITEQQREHERLQQADKLRALGQLASGVAHNFNNALAAIIGYTQLALPKVEGTEIEKHLHIVEQSARDAARMVERIHNFSRGGSRSEDFIPLRILDIVRDAIDMTRPRWRDDAEALGIKYEVNFHCQAEESLMVKGEPSELREVFINIILNALDAMPVGGSVRISVSVEEEKAAIEITDTGNGMTEEIRQRIFEPFFTTKGVLGLGMGLSETYRIVERHGGRIEVESQLRQGTTFTVTLPLVQRAAVEAGTEEADMTVHPVRILIIDDERNVRSILAEVLARQGHRVMEAANAEEGLRHTDEQEFDVVFTDLAMPGIDGIATAARIKSRHPSTKVVLMSGYGADKAYELAGDSRIIDAAISKPFRLAELQKVLSTVMKKA